MEQKKNPYQSDPGTWQTGRTEPPKHHSALISILLVLVILLSGIATALSILNLKLYKELTQRTPEAPPVAFSRGEEIAPAAYHEEDLPIPQLGLRGTVIPEVYQRYYKLPSGFYITQVTADGQAARNGLLAGDIITRINSSEITSDDSVTALAKSLRNGDVLELTVYRAGTTFTASLVWED